MMPVQSERAYYLHLINGELEIADQKLKAGDGIKLTQLTELMVKAGTDAVRALWFDLPL